MYIFIYTYIFALMVVSRIDEHVHYKENREIEESDKRHSATIYEYDILDNDTFYTISLGQEDTNYAKKDIYFFRVYLVSVDDEKGDRVKSQIGVFEYKSVIQDPSKRLKTVSDSDGDIDFEKLDSPILYSFVTKRFLDSAISLKKSQMGAEEDTIDIKVPDVDKGDGEGDDEDNVFDIPKDLPKTADTVREPGHTRLSKDRIFEIQTSFQPPKLLTEETAEMAKELKDEFRDSANTTWIEKFMKNNEYTIVETATNGDCFFDTVVKAFEQIGKITTVAKLRAILAEEVTQDFYDMNRTIYLDAFAEQDNIVKKKKTLKKDFKECKKRAENTTSKTEAEKIIKDDCRILTNKYEDLKKEEKSNGDILQEFDFMKQVDSLEKLKQVIQTTAFWANTWAISTLERRLNVKIVVMNKTAFDAGDENSVLLCGQLNDAVLEQQGFFRPDHYIITEYSGNHYKLIAYKQKRIFEFSEIPFYIKTLIFNKCLERNAGPYYLIDDIRNFNTKMGMDAAEFTGLRQSEHEDEDLDRNNKHLYDNSDVFMYYNRSDGKLAPGKGNGEQVNPKHLMDFRELKSVKDWRRMLDDDWPEPFKLDGHMWETVEHYYQGAKFKEKNRDFYLQFTVDSGSPFAKDPALAHAAGSKSGKIRNKSEKTDTVFRDKKIQIDPDFYGPRHLEERRKALYAKFSQNEVLKNVLLNTKQAKLTAYVPKKPAVVDTELMIVRKDLVDGREEK